MSKNPTSNISSVNDVITVTIVDITNATEQPISESISISANTSLSDFTEFIAALLPSLLLNNSTGTGIQLIKDGAVLYTSTAIAGLNAEKVTATLHEIGIVDNDIIACRRLSADSTGTTGSSIISQQQQQQSLLSTGSTTSATVNTGLDFTNLLQGYNNHPQAQATPQADYIYHGPTMNLQEAQYYNPHPTKMVTLLYEKPHLLKELNYYAPTLAEQLVSLQQTSNGNDANGVITNASEVYRNYMIQQSITSAFNKTSKYHLENEMRLRHAQNPNDIEATEYVQKQERQKLIQEQYEYVMNEYPESIVGRVLMLYIPMKINGFPVSAFIDSGAQQTIMSLSLAKQCQIDQYIDTRMAGIAVGVGTGVILGRIHIVQIEITSSITQQIYYFPCSITVMDDPKKPKSNPTVNLIPGNSTTNDGKMQLDSDQVDFDGDEEAVGGKEMPFLFGLDMLRRHLCCLDLNKGCLRFTQIRIDTDKNEAIDTDDNNSSTPQYLEVPFLHEKDLLPSQGGTMKQ